MLARLNEPALAELTEAYRAEFLSGAGPAALLDRRSLASTRGHTILGEYRASSYAHASRAYLAHFKPSIDTLDAPASAALLPYIAVDDCLDITVDHAAWLALLPAQQQAWLDGCPLAEVVAIARARARPELRVIGAYAISIAGTIRLTSWHDDLLAEAEALGPGAFDGLTLTFSVYVADQDRWRALTHAHAPQ